MKEVNIIFPHQLFQDSPLLDHKCPSYLVEEHLFFNQYAFHKQKIAFHRASMKGYEKHLVSKGYDCNYIDARESKADIRELITYLADQGVEKVHYIDTTDDWLEKRIKRAASTHNVEVVNYNSPLFLNTKEDLKTFFRTDKKKFFQTEFYISERKKREILIEGDAQPVGGKWSFDTENRKKYPTKKTPPPIEFPQPDSLFDESNTYTSKYFKNNPGELTDTPLYPTDFKSTDAWLDQFLKHRFEEFGAFEDAIVSNQSILHHSVLTPMLNVGLITPQKIIDVSVAYGIKHNIPLNSLEGFIRQIIGWREFMRGMYETKGIEERTTNFWGFDRKIPSSFYDGTTGIEPIDIVIKKVLKTGYCHHIERLMVLGNFMLLCEFDPDEVYRWFMELFIDAYDWVMVPNVYGMSQFADGGLLATKPYISGSNYLMKMSNFKKGDWQPIWDGLFWRFMHVNRDFFTKNPRLGMLIRTFDKMNDEKRDAHLFNAERYLEKL